MSEKELLFDVCVNDDAHHYEFIQFKFILKNGLTKIEIRNEYGYIKYYDSSEVELKYVQFHSEKVMDASGSFHIALKQILVFDSQNISKAIDNNLAVDRASFGLAEVS
jgi:hypothetical protein